MFLCVEHWGWECPRRKICEIGNEAKEAKSVASAFVIEILYIDIYRKRNKSERIQRGGEVSCEAGQSQTSLEMMEIFRLFYV